MKLATFLLIAALLGTTAVADPVHVNITGVVEFNQISRGEFQAVRPGDPVQINFQLDSNSFLDSPTVPTRGYNINAASFVLTMGPATALLQSPFPGTPYFVIRNNDPAVDGFFFSGGPGVDLPAALTLDEPANAAGTRFFTIHFLVTYGGTRLPSLNILDAIGFYDYTGLTVYGFAIEDLSFQPLGIVFTNMTIETVVAVEPKTWSGLKALYQ